MDDEQRTPRTDQRAKKPGPAPKTDWYATFLETLRTTPIVRTACLRAGVGRSTAYDARHRDEDFLLAWNEALEEGAETFEQFAFARAREGQPIEKTVTKTHSDGTVEVTVTEERHVSDTVLLRVLARLKPEYRDRHELTGSGGGPITHKVEGALDELYAELERLSEPD